MNVEAVVRCGNRHGEGVFWSASHHLLYWTDIVGEKIWTLDPDTATALSFSTPGRVCCFATRKGRRWNEVAAAFDDGFAFLDLISGDRRVIGSVEADLPNTRLNDGRTDRQGRFIAGGMDEGGKGPTSAVYRLDADLSIAKLFDGVGCANGTCFSADGRTMWFADSLKGDIERFDYDIATGAVSNRRAIGHTPKPGVPDGSCIDSEGCVWNAVWEGYRVERWSPDGRILAVVDVPVKKPTCCAFGGPRLDTLYITSSQLGERPSDLEREPLAGHLFAVKPGVTGLADAEFTA
jgi:L-arabinonolactonase